MSLSTSVQKRITWWLAPLLFGLTAMLYWPACGNEFVNLDDGLYVTKNPEVLKGIRSDGLTWALTTRHAGNWHPLTWLSLQLDASLFGPSAVGFHRTNVLLHAASTALLFLALYALTGVVWPSALVAALFAVHPLHVESVAWVSERKDVLSALFFMLTLLAYARYAAIPTVGRYFLVLLAAGLGVMAKPMLVTLPCVLLLLDIWPLGRLRVPFGPQDRIVPRPTVLPGMDTYQRGASSRCMPSPLRRVIAEKIPLFALAGTAATLTMFAQTKSDYTRTLLELPLGTRLGNALVSYMVYLGQTCWPVNLAAFYPHPSGGLASLEIVGAALLVMALSGLAIWQVRSRPYMFVGWFWFLGMLVPVIGIIQVGDQARADRYTYLPHIGIFLLAVWGLCPIAERSRPRLVVCTVGVVVVVASCAVLTLRQIEVWHDSHRLWSHALAMIPGNWGASHCLAEVEIGQERKSEAVEILREAARNRPDSDFMVLNCLGADLAGYGAYEEGGATLTRALQSHPEVAEIYGNRGKVMSVQSKWPAAVADYREAIRLSPRKASYRYYLAHALSKTGDAAGSESEYLAGIRLDPKWPERAAASAWRNATDQNPLERNGVWAVQLAEQASEAREGRRPELLDVLAAALAEAGRFEEALATAERAIRGAEKAGREDIAATVRERCEFYRQHKPFHDSPR
jgi:tetratricopeptide (TPR) repeat protein